MCFKKSNLNHLLALTISSHLSQKDKIAKIGQIYYDRNLKLLDFLGDLFVKSNAIALKSYFELALNLKKVNFNKLIMSTRGLRVFLDDFKGSLKTGEVASSLKHALALSKNMDEGLNGIFAD